MRTYEPYQQIHLLDTMLLTANMPHKVLQCWDGVQIRLYADWACTKEIDDVVYHSFSHGYKLGLLESYRLGECDGYETAEEIFRGWEKMYEKERVDK